LEKIKVENKSVSELTLQARRRQFTAVKIPTVLCKINNFSHGEEDEARKSCSSEKEINNSTAF
ncbi:unnamed protein product, partial [Bubo scandiacus]